MHDIQSSYEVDPNDLRLVFLVDPDKNHNQYIAKILENISYLVQPFNSFEEFKTFFLGENYLKAKALILVMEVIEQNTQTIEFINEHVINSSQNLPVVILSSDDNLLERLKIIRWGYHSLLKKYAGLSQLNDLFNRLGIVKTLTADQTQLQLEKIVPKKWKMDAHHLLILNGRRVCKSQNPSCDECSLNKLCSYNLVNIH